MASRIHGVSEWCYAIGKIVPCIPAGGYQVRAAEEEGLDKALHLLWTLVDEAGSRCTLDLFMRMAE
jgi:hypothetical protein